jgi:SulP family sulfate permease
MNQVKSFDFGYLLSEWKDMLGPKTVVKDVWAGITVALVALPLNLALAIAAGVPPGVGITTGIIAGVIAAFFGGQKFAITGPAAAMAVVLVEIAENYGLNAIWLVCLLAGIFQLIAGFSKLGRFISFLPRPVIVGFANAIGVLIFFNALDDFLGLPTKKLVSADQHPPAITAFVPDFVEDLAHIWHRCVVHNEMNFYAILIGAVALIIAYLTPRVTKAVPGQLVGILAATLLTGLLHFNIPLIKDVASIPNVLPMPSIPSLPWNDLVVLFPFAVTVFLLGSIESLLSASVADGMTGSTRHRSNQELIGQGLANVIVPFFGGIPVTGVIARTSVNIRSGAQTRLAALVHSGTLAILIFFLAQYAERIPLAALAAILMLTGIKVIEWDTMRSMWRGSRAETAVALATSIASIAVDLTAGVFIGLAFACALFIGRMSNLKQMQIPTEELANSKFLRTYVVDGPLFFGAAEKFIENISIVDDVKAVILHMRSVTVLDVTGVETLLSIQKQLHKQGGRLVIAELPQQPLMLMERLGATEKIGKENMFSDYRTAVVSVNAQLVDGAATQLPDKSGLEWLFPVMSSDDVPIILRDTPLENLLKGQNLGLVDPPTTNAPEMVVGMCIDFRKTLTIPRDWAFIIRREGANMDGAEFAIALAISKGVRHMALIAHNDCAMANTAQHRKQFVEVLSNEIGWEGKKAEEFFDEHARSREIGNEIDFVLQEAQRIEGLFPGLRVLPLLFRVDDGKLYLIYDWLVKHAAHDPILNRVVARTTGEFVKPHR